MPRFVYDPDKSQTNKIKHGIDFSEIQALWEDVDRIVIPVRDIDEPRFLVIGSNGNKIWSCIYTMRDEKIRIISARRARKEEIDIYESEGI